MSSFTNFMQRKHLTCLKHCFLIISVNKIVINWNPLNVMCVCLNCVCIHRKEINSWPIKNNRSPVSSGNYAIHKVGTTITQCREGSPITASILDCSVDCDDLAPVSAHCSPIGLSWEQGTKLLGHMVGINTVFGTSVISTHDNGGRGRCWITGHQQHIHRADYLETFITCNYHDSFLKALFTYWF